jgi:hypothetical protein
VSPHHSCKATRFVTLDRGPYRVLSAGASRTLFFFEVVTPPPPPFSTGLGTVYGGVIIIIIIIIILLLLLTTTTTRVICWKNQINRFLLSSSICSGWLASYIN